MKVRNSRIEGRTLVTDWADKVQTRMDVSGLETAIIEALTMHGLTQKVMDAHSGVYAKTQSVAACREATMAVWEGLVAGTWNLGRESYGWATRALADLGKMSQEDAKRTVDAMTEDELKEFVRFPEVKLWKAEDDATRLREASKAAKGGLAKFLKTAKP